MVMLRFFMIEDGVVYYYYQPNGQGEWGIVAYDTKTGKKYLVKMAEHDIDRVSFVRYHIYDFLEECSQKGEYPKETYVAWG